MLVECARRTYLPMPRLRGAPFVCILETGGAPASLSFPQERLVPKLQTSRQRDGQSAHAATTAANSRRILLAMRSLTSHSCATGMPVCGSVCMYGGGPNSGSAHTSPPRSACAAQICRHQPKCASTSGRHSGASGSATCDERERDAAAKGQRRADSCEQSQSDGSSKSSCTCMPSCKLQGTDRAAGLKLRSGLGSHGKRTNI
eukprot:6213938-Pleurochrysis_carterae.AAC.2